MTLPLCIAIAILHTRPGVCVTIPSWLPDAESSYVDFRTHAPINSNTLRSMLSIVDGCFERQGVAKAHDGNGTLFDPATLKRPEYDYSGYPRRIVKRIDDDIEDVTDFPDGGFTSSLFSARPWIVTVQGVPVTNRFATSFGKGIGIYFDEPGWFGNAWETLSQRGDSEQDDSGNKTISMEMVLDTFLDASDYDLYPHSYWVPTDKIAPICPFEDSSFGAFYQVDVLPGIHNSYDMVGFWSVVEEYKRQAPRGGNLLSAFDTGTNYCGRTRRLTSDRFDFLAQGVAALDTLWNKEPYRTLYYHDSELKKHYTLTGRYNYRPGSSTKRPNAGMSVGWDGEQYVGTLAAGILSNVNVIDWSVTNETYLVIGGQTQETTFFGFRHKLNTGKITLWARVEMPVRIGLEDLAGLVSTNGSFVEFYLRDEEVGTSSPTLQAALVDVVSPHRWEEERPPPAPAGVVYLSTPPALYMFDGSMLLTGTADVETTFKYTEEPPTWDPSMLACNLFPAQCFRPMIERVDYFAGLGVVASTNQHAIEAVDLQESFRTGWRISDIPTGEDSRISYRLSHFTKTGIYAPEECYYVNCGILYDKCLTQVRNLNGIGDEVNKLEPYDIATKLRLDEDRAKNGSWNPRRVKLGGSYDKTYPTDCPVVAKIKPNGQVGLFYYSEETGIGGEVQPDWDGNYTIGYLVWGGDQPVYDAPLTWANFAAEGRMTPWAAYRFDYKNLSPHRK